MSDPFALDDDPVDPFEPAPLPERLPWLDALNPEQRLAVETTEGPLLVLSGAGTGKTRVLTSRLAYILLSGRAKPWQCLAVTFTNRAAREMRERIAQLAGPAVERVWLGTFHALGVRMLRRHAGLVGLTSDFTILDSDDQLRLLKQVMDAEGLDTRKTPPQMVMNVIQRWKDRGLAPERTETGEAAGLPPGRAQKLYARYQERLRSLNACDFGDLLLHVLTILQSDPDVLADYQDRFRYILVDEYQDTNVAQYLWLRLLAQKHRNLCCVGDDDQSIYSWRGAEVANILKFDKDFPDAQIVRLESNYRSTPAILAAASGLIGHNRGRLGKTLRPGRTDAEAGDKLILKNVWDGEEEARWVAEEIEARQRAGTPLDQIAVLVRAGFQTREFEERFITTGIPYRVIGGPRFYERQEIRDALAYLRVVAQPADDLAFERIVNVPKRGLGDATLQSLHIHARAQGVPLQEAARQLVETDELKPRARQSLAALIADFARWRSLLPGLAHPELARTILDESGYTGMWQKERSPDAQGRLDNLKELTAAMEEFGSLAGFLEHVALVMENDEKGDARRVTVMTLHAAKGLEFDTVFLPGWEEGLFPHQRALEESGAKGLEEERRLAYVGLTRARRRVYISHAANRRIYNQWQSSLPSRFIDELPPETVESTSDLAVASGGWSQAWGRRETSRTPAPAVTVKSSDYSPGDRVFHQKFGNGRIIAIDGNKLEIDFDKAGVKRVIDSFVTSLQP